MAISETRTFNGIKFVINTGLMDGSGIAINPLLYREHHARRENFLEALEMAMDAYPSIEAFHYLCEMIHAPYGDELNRWPEESLRKIVDSFTVACRSIHITQNERNIVRPIVEDATAELLRRYEKQRAKESTRSEYVRPGYVYVIQSPTGAFKIGRTKNPKDRMKTFSVKLPFEVEYIAVIQSNNMYELEYNLHAKFADKRINGEWFELSPEDVEYIKGLAS